MAARHSASALGSLALRFRQSSLSLFNPNSTLLLNETRSFTTSAFLKQQPQPLPHAGLQPTSTTTTNNTDDECKGDYLMMRPVYANEYLEKVKPTHKPPQKMHEKVALGLIQIARKAFDLGTGYGPNMTEALWLRRFLFLETVAGVPGMVAGMLRHMRSLRTMKRDKGWIHTLLEEAENERMHLLTFLELKKPSFLFRMNVLIAQGVFFNAYMASYILFPKTCHAFIGYLEEEAVKTYTHCLEDIDSGKLKNWQTQPPPSIGKMYWRLPEGSTMRDLILAVRADEACHSYVNHRFSEMKPDENNPFEVGTLHIP